MLDAAMTARRSDARRHRARRNRGEIVTRRQLLVGGVSAVILATLYRVTARTPSVQAATFDVSHSDEEWRRLLTPSQYAVLRRSGTESPWSSPLLDEHRAGTFHCAGCDLAVFSSTTKFDSGTGWPSFWAPLRNAVATAVDNSIFGERTEVHCARCGGHLGHVFEDGPAPTGLRYCMNGAALTFAPA
jgi:peptide-methionine (R)-S-oxide reductase